MHECVHADWDTKRKLRRLRRDWADTPSTGGARREAGRDRGGDGWTGRRGTAGWRSQIRHAVTYLSRSLPGSQRRASCCASLNGWRGARSLSPSRRAGGWRRQRLRRSMASGCRDSLRPASSRARRSGPSSCTGGPKRRGRCREPRRFRLRGRCACSRPWPRPATGGGGRAIRRQARTRRGGEGRDRARRGRRSRSRTRTSGGS